jgi:hypothetical protein
VEFEKGKADRQRYGPEGVIRKIRDSEFEKLRREVFVLGNTTKKDADVKDVCRPS